MFATLNESRFVGAILLSFAFLSFGPDRSSAADGPVGRFCGELRSNGIMVPATTVIRVDDEGGLHGEYLFYDGDEQVDGTLDGIVKVTGTANPKVAGADRTYRFWWVDFYGGGTLEITFDPEFRSFEGHWGMADETPDKEWRGERCNEMSGQKAKIRGVTVENFPPD